MTVRQQQRRDTAANWTSNDPTLVAGEIGVETDTGRFKIGDGATAWTSLEYAAPETPNPAGGAQNFAPIDDPVFTTGVETPALDVTGDCADLRIVPAGDGDIALDIEVGNTHTADALSIRRTADPDTDPDIDVFRVEPDGTTTVTGNATVTGNVTAGDGAGAHVDVVGSAVTIEEDASNLVEIDAAATAANAVLGITNAGSVIASILANGRITKTGSWAGDSDVLNKGEADDLYGLKSTGTSVGTFVALSVNSGSVTVPGSSGQTWFVFLVGRVDEGSAGTPVPFVGASFRTGGTSWSPGTNGPSAVTGPSRLDGFAVRIA